MSDESFNHSIDEDFDDDFEEESVVSPGQSYTMSKTLSKEDSPSSGNDEGSLTEEDGKGSTPPSKQVSPKAAKSPTKGSKESLAEDSSKGSPTKSNKESSAEDLTPSKGKVPSLELPDRAKWISGGLPSSARDHLFRSTDSKLFSLRSQYSERVHPRGIIVRDLSPTHASARKIPRGTLKQMEEDKRKKEESGEENRSATSATGSQLPSPKANRNRLPYGQRPANAVWAEISREFRPFMRVKAEYTTPAGKKVVAFGQLLSGWEVPKTRLREGPHARPPPGKELPPAKAVTTLPLIEKERSGKYVRVKLHDGVERLVLRNKVKDAEPADIFR